MFRLCIQNWERKRRTWNSNIWGPSYVSYCARSFTGTIVIATSEAISDFPQCNWDLKKLFFASNYKADDRAKTWRSCPFYDFWHCKLLEKRGICTWSRHSHPGLWTYWGWESPHLSLQVEPQEKTTHSVPSDSDTLLCTTDMISDPVSLYWTRRNK
jgi:hypothetical protein